MSDISDQSNKVSIGDDYFSIPSTSNSRIQFTIFNENKDLCHTFFLSENDTVGKINEM